MDPPIERLNIVQINIPDEQAYTEGFETPSLAKLYPHELCKHCSSIPFNLLGFHGKIRMEELDKHFPQKDRPLADVFKNLTKCFFCQKIALIFQDFNRQKCGSLPLSKLGQIMVDILPNWLHSVEKDDNGHCEGRLLRLGIEFIFWDFKPDGDLYSPNFVFQRCSVPTLKTSDFCTDQSIEDWFVEDSQPYCGRIRPLVADLQILQKWKILCISQHQQDCNTLFMGDHLSRIRLIDVEEMCIVEAPQGQEYVALSYVWGQAEMLRLQRSNLEFLQKPGSLNLTIMPATIADAAEVTKAIGERYLWVDALCIIQDDDADKAYFIPNMDTVYGCALLTIIALSGEGASAGLPGIRHGSRNRLEFPFIIGETPIMASLDPARTTSWGNYMGHSLWNSRGWTFQERIFSRRALVFTSEQIYWECQKGSWCEDSIWEVLKPPHIFRKAFNSDEFLFPWSPDLGHFAETYRLLVEKYSSRKFSFQSDCLNAFAGILHAAERTWDQTFFWGIPCSFFSSALQWKINSQENPRRRVASVLYQAREGDHSTMISLPVPSWTWAGWENDISMANFDPQGMAIEVKFYRMGSKGQLVEINESSQQQIRSEENTLRQKWKKVNDAVVQVGDLSMDVIKSPKLANFFDLLEQLCFDILELGC